MGNLDPEHDNFEVGEEVMYTLGQYPYRTVKAIVCKVTPARVTIEYGNSETAVLHRRKWGRPFECRRVTDADRAQEKYEADLLKWQQSHPATRRLTLRFASSSVRLSLDTVGADVDAMHEIAAEVHAIREWLLKRPEEPR